MMAEPGPARQHFARKGHGKRRRHWAARALNTGIASVDCSARARKLPTGRLSWLEEAARFNVVAELQHGSGAGVARRHHVHKVLGQRHHHWAARALSGASQRIGGPVLVASRQGEVVRDQKVRGTYRRVG